jgi:hypothetical protein
MSRLLALAAVTAFAALGMARFAEAAPQVVLRAIASSQPDVLVWVDKPDSTTTDPDTKSFEDAFASTTWLWLDDGTLLIRRGDDTLVASAHYRALDNSNTFWALHNRREYTLDGSADRDPDNPATGGATLYITVPGDNGSSTTARVEIRLSFQQ